jgi:hypothetical protein
MNIRFSLRWRLRASTLALLYAVLTANVAHAQQFLVINVRSQTKAGTTESIIYHSPGHAFRIIDGTTGAPAGEKLPTTTDLTELLMPATESTRARR